MPGGSEIEVEERILTTPAGKLLLAEVASHPTPVPADLARWRRSHSAEEVAAALRLAEGRRRGAAKFSRADAMWFDGVGLEQATAEAVALHKAERFRNALVVDLCCGIGGDSIALARVGHVLSVDVDEGKLRRCRWNTKVYGVGERLAPFRSPAEDFPLPPDAYVHIDPDRRARGGFRTRRVAEYVPGLEFLQGLPKKVKAGAIKLSPAGDFAKHFDGPEFEIEVISLGGECKEAAVWFGRVADVRRKATVLPAGVSWTDRDGPAIEEKAPTVPLSEWILDPDPSLARAGLLDSFALANDLGRFAPGVDLLTSPRRLESPFVSAFRVVERFPLDMKQLKRAVAELKLGPLEIKTRGIDLLPENVRKHLRPEGPNPAALFLIGGKGGSTAVVAGRA